MKKLVLFVLFFSCAVFAVQVVENGESLKGESKFSVKLEKRIMLEPEDGDLIISKISSLAVDNKGNIFIVDMGSTTVYKYDKNGKYLMSIGRKGQGPGEFQRAYNIAIDNDGNLYLSDDGISKFTNQGKFIYKKKKSMSQMLESFIPLKSGDFIFGGITLDESGKVLKFVRKIEIVNSELKPIKKLFEVSQEAGKNGLNGDKVMFFSILALDKDRVYRLENKDNVLTIDVYNDKGKIVQKSVKKFKKVKKTAEQIKKEEEWIEKINKRSGGNYQGKIEENKRSVVNSKLDDKSNLWIKTIGEKSEDRTTYFDIINSKGKYVGRIETGQKFYSWIVKNNYLYCVEDNEDDGYCLYKYKISEK